MSSAAPYRPTLVEVAELPLAAERVGWELEDGALVRRVRRGDFAGALRFVNEVAAIAESRNHHPDIEISWDTVTLRLSTHSLGGVSDYDLALAEALNPLF